MFDEILKLGWIEPADDGAEWASPAFPVAKKTKDTWRLVDNRELSEATIRDVFFSFAARRSNSGKARKLSDFQRH